MFQIWQPKFESQIWKVFLSVDIIRLQDVKSYLVSMALKFYLLNILFEYSIQNQ